MPYGGTHSLPPQNVSDGAEQSRCREGVVHETSNLTDYKFHNQQPLMGDTFKTRAACFCGDGCSRWENYVLHDRDVQRAHRARRAWLDKARVGATKSDVLSTSMATGGANLVKLTRLRRSPRQNTMCSLHRQAAQPFVPRGEDRRTSGWQHRHCRFLAFPLPSTAESSKKDKQGRRASVGQHHCRLRCRAHLTFYRLARDFFCALAQASRHHACGN